MVGHLPDHFQVKCPFSWQTRIHTHISLFLPNIMKYYSQNDGNSVKATLGR